MVNYKDFLKTIAFSLAILYSCKTFELKEEARNTIISNNSKIETSNLCIYITTITADANEKNDEEKSNDLKNTAHSNGGNFILTDYFKIQKPTSDGKLETIPAFGVYNCENPSTLLTTLENKEKEQLYEEKRQAELRLDKIPHHWVICESNNFSTTPIPLTQSMLAQMKPKAYETKNECDKRASITNQIGREFGFQCSCQYRVLNK